MKIRITAPVVEHGSVQLLRGRVLNVPEKLAIELVGSGEAQLMPIGETATRPLPENAMLPRPISKPKPPAARRSR